MKRETIVSILIFLGVQVLAWVAMWLSGYNFDERNLIVAIWFVFNFISGILIAESYYKGANEQDILKEIYKKKCIKE